VPLLPVFKEPTRCNERDAKLRHFNLPAPSSPHPGDSGTGLQNYAISIIAHSPSFLTEGRKAWQGSAKLQSSLHLDNLPHLGTGRCPKALCRPLLTWELVKGAPLSLKGTCKASVATGPAARVPIRAVDRL